MTCIVGLAHENGVIIGGDSAGTGGHTQTIRADTKVFRNGGYILGFTSSFRMGQILRYCDLPEATAHWDLDRFMATTFIDGVREALVTGGWMRKDSERESGGTFLVGVRGSLYAIDSDFQIGRNHCGYAACGSGQEIALGSLHTSDEAGFLPRRRVEVALTAAAEHNSTVAGPFILEETA